LGVGDDVQDRNDNRHLCIKIIEPIFADMPAVELDAKMSALQRVRLAGKYTKARSNKARSNPVVKIVKPGQNFENPSDASYKNVNIIIYVIYYIEENQKGVILTVEVFLFSIKFLNHSDLE